LRAGTAPEEANALLTGLAQFGVVRELEPPLAAGVLIHSLVLHTDVRCMDVESYALFCNVEVEVEDLSKRAPALVPAAARAERASALGDARIRAELHDRFSPHTLH
jgi:hypothetical protein